MNSDTLLVLYHVVEKLNEEFYEPQMETGQAILLIIHVYHDSAAVRLGGMCVWDTEEHEGENSEDIEAEMRAEIRALIKSLSKIEA